MNRRTILAAAVASLAASPASANERGHGEQLRTLIETVVAEGDMTGLDQLVTEDITIPGMGVDGIDAFRAASNTGHVRRAERYTEMTFDVLSIAEAGEWAHALVYFKGVLSNGRTEEQHLFYVARFSGEKVAVLYLK